MSNSLNRCITLLICCIATCSCNNISIADGDAPHTLQLYVKKPLSYVAQLAVNSLDIYSFGADTLGYIDSYIRLEDPTGEQIELPALRGERRVVAVANANPSMADSVFCYKDLANQTIRLADDNPEAPVMVAEELVMNGNGFGAVLTLRPLLCRVGLLSLKVSYPDSLPLTNVRCYLTNVNAATKLIGYNSSYPTEIYNYSYLNSVDLERLGRPSMLLQSIPGEVGAKGYNKVLYLYCYMNQTDFETLGTPFTRLVIEGEHNGHIQYYPININRYGFRQEYYATHDGLSSGNEYLFRILITEDGSAWADEPVSARSP